MPPFKESPESITNQDQPVQAMDAEEKDVKEYPEIVANGRKFDLEVEIQDQEEKVDEIKMIIELPHFVDSLDQVPERCRKYFSEGEKGVRVPLGEGEEGGYGSPYKTLIKSGYHLSTEAEVEMLIENVAPYLPKTLSDLYTKLKQRSFFSKEEYENIDPEHSTHGTPDDSSEWEERDYNDQSAKTIEEYVLNSSKNLNVVKPLSDLFEKASWHSFILLDIFAPRTEYMKDVWVNNSLFREALTYFMSEKFQYEDETWQANVRDHFVDSLVAIYKDFKFDIEVSPYYDKGTGAERYVRFKVEDEDYKYGRSKSLKDSDFIVPVEVQKSLVESCISQYLKEKSSSGTTPSNNVQ